VVLHFNLGRAWFGFDYTLLINEDNYRFDCLNHCDITFENISSAARRDEVAKRR
jgi:hypothetical protein